MGSPGKWSCPWHRFRAWRGEIALLVLLSRGGTHRYALKGKRLASPPPESLPDADRALHPGVKGAEEVQRRSGRGRDQPVHGASWEKQERVAGGVETGVSRLEHRDRD